MKKVIITALVFIFFTGCASLKSSMSDKRSVVVRAAKNMTGKKYAYGKQNKHTGFDCSGLAQFAYREAGIGIPRTAKAQHARSRKTDRGGLKKADLVFFSTLGPGATHVGIYLGADKFIHAPSKGKTVRIDSMNNVYWKKAYYGAGKYIE